jgi:hypothetical protein
MTEMSNKTIIVGGVAGGMSAATRLRRLDEKAEIVVFERGHYRITSAASSPTGPACCCRALNLSPPASTSMCASTTR